MDKETDLDLDLDLDRVLPEIITLAQQAGRVILDIYETDFQVTHKKDNTPVTAADIAASKLIVDVLSELTPDIPVLSEESDEIPFEKRAGWETYWLVDPLDGTKTFVDKTGEFSVNIALIHQHRSILGVIYSPIKHCSFYAYKGSGAFYLKDNDLMQALPIYTKANIDKSTGVVVACTQSSHYPPLQVFLDNLEKEFNSYEIKYMGSSLKSCMVAEGKADIYARLGPTSEWDTAAAQCIVEEAGGLITDTNMQVLKYNTKDSLLNPKFFVFGDTSICWQRFLLK